MGNINTNIGTSFRIPNLPMGKIVDDKGFATDEESTFRQALITLLQQLMGNEGLVAPSQSATNINTITSNVANTPGAIGTAYPCGFGTLFYNSTDNTLQVTINNGSGAPEIKTVTIS